VSVAARIARFTAWRWAVPTALAVGLSLLTAGTVLQRSRERAWARAIAIPEIERLAATGLWHDAYSLGTRVIRLLPSDSAATRVWRMVSIATTITSVPAGADIFVREVADTSQVAWRYLGHTPLPERDLPHGLKVWRLALHGYAVLDTAALPGRLTFTLRRINP
jgi:hypothetical protein